MFERKRCRKVEGKDLEILLQSVEVMLQLYSSKLPNN